MRYKIQRLGTVRARGDVAATAGPVDVCKIDKREISAYGVHISVDCLRMSWPDLSFEFSLPGLTRKVCAPK